MLPVPEAFTDVYEAALTTLPAVSDPVPKVIAGRETFRGRDARKRMVVSAVDGNAIAGKLIDGCVIEVYEDAGQAD